MSWTQVLPALGVEIPTPTLPARVRCPLCKGNNLHILNDAAVSGQWHSCDDCHSSGDLLQLASRYWKLSLGATATKLTHYGCEFPPERLSPAGLQSSQRTFDYQARFQRGWTRSRQNLATGLPGIGALLWQFGLRCDLSPERLQQGPGQLVGGATRTEIEQMYFEFGVADPTKPGHNHSPAAVLAGPKWGNCLHLPYWDMPGRICANLFIGRTAQRSQDWIFRELDTPTRGGYDAGLALHPHVPRAARARGSFVVGLEDPLQALKLQWRQFRRHATPLPLVSWRHGPKSRSRRCWQNLLPGRKIVLWAQEITPQLLIQALQTDADISLAGPDQSTPARLQNWLLKFPADKIWEIVVQLRKPWTQVVAHYLQHADDATIEELFHVFRQHQEPIEQLLAPCSSTTRSHLQTLLEPNQQYPQVAVDQMIVSEQRGSWVHLGSRHTTLICDAILQIDRVIHQQGRQTTYYQGSLHYQGHSLEFCERKEIVEKQTLCWMQAQILRAGWGLMRYSWKNQQLIVPTALQFRPPEFVNALDVVGWDPGTMSFVFPSFQLDAQGQIQPLDLPPCGPHTPCLTLPQPQPLSPLEIYHATATGPGAALGWAILLANWINVLAPTCGEEPGGILLGGAGAMAAGRTAHQQLGWPLRRLRDLNPLEPVSHRWPVLYFPTVTHRMVRSLYDLTDSRNHVASALPWKSAAGLYLHGGWTLVEQQTAVSLPINLLENISQLSINYLQDLAQRGYRLSGTNWPFNLAQDVADWLQRLGGSPQVVTDGLFRLRVPTARARADLFGELLALRHIHRRLAVLSPGEHQSAPHLVLYDDRLFIPKGLPMVDHALPLSPNELDQLLDDAGLLLEEADYGNWSGWLVPLTWWKQRLQHWRVASPLKLRHG